MPLLRLPLNFSNRETDRRGRTALLLAILFAFAGCAPKIATTVVATGASTTTESTPTTAPSIVYSGAISATVGVAISSSTPTNSGGSIASCAIAPDLNGGTGLTFNSTTCVISGTASSAQGATSYTVTATNAAGSGQTTVSVTSSLPAAPGTPANLSAVAAGSSVITLDWDDTATATSYTVKRYASAVDAGNDASATTLTCANSALSTCSSTGLSASTQYWYRVSATNAGGTSALASAANATTTVAAPGTPANLTAAASSASVVALDWDDTAGAATYTVKRYASAVDAGNDASATTLTCADATLSTCSSTGLSAGTTYYYRVSATNAGGTSALIAAVSALTYPATPSSSSASAASATAIDLDWDSMTGAATYTVKRYGSSVDAGNDASSTTVTCADSAASACQDTGRAAGTSYWYRISATNASGTSALASSVTALTYPATPTLTATAGDAQVALSWAAVTGAASYTVSWSTDNSTYTNLTGCIATAGTSCTHSSLTNGTLYYYKILSTNASGSSALSSAQSATPAASSIVTSGLVLHLDAADADGTNPYANGTCSDTTWQDLTANNLDGTLTNYGSCGASTGWNGTGSTSSPYALVFDGSNDYVQVGHHASLNTAGTYTLEAWAKLPNSNQNATLITKRLNSSPWTQMSLTVTGTDTYGTGSGKRIALITIENHTVKDRGIYTNRDIADGNWHHIVGVSDAASQTLKIYVDGNLESVTADHTNGAWPSSNNAGSLYVGSNTFSYLNGSIAKAAVYNSALTASGVSQNCNALKSRFSGATCADNAPTAISGLKLWLKADSLSGADGAAVSSWPDSSANGNTATQGTGSNQPTLQSDSSSLQNGRPVVRFDGSDDALINSLVLSGAKSVFMVYKLAALPGSGGWYSPLTIKNSATSFSEFEFLDIGGYQPTSYRFDFLNAAASVGFSTALSTNASLLTLSYNGGTNTSTGSYGQYLGGASQSGSSTGNFGRTGTDLGSIGARLASDGTTASGPLNGDIAEILVYDTVLGTSDRQTAECYLGNKYALTLDAGVDCTTAYPAPTAPSALSATAASASQIDLSWTASSTAGTGQITGYKIDRSLDANADDVADSWSQIATVGASTTTYSSTGLSASTKYLYRVRAYTAGGNSSYATQDDATTTVASSSAISGGYGHYCAAISGAMKCWGNTNGYGTLGDGSTTNSSGATVQVTGFTTGSTAVSANNGYYYSHFCGVTGGAAKCWAMNDYGEVGDGSSGSNAASPVQVSGLTSGATAVASGTYNNCAIVSGAVKCWGLNTDGQLGNSSNTTSTVPVQVTGLTSGATAVGVGDSVACAIVSGAVHCWGLGSSGTLGNGGTASSNVPVQVTGLTSGATALAVGGLSACAVVSGAVKCWGYNNGGQLGNGNTTQQNSPVQVTGLTSGATEVAVESYRGHACAVVSGAAKCWGINDNGQLGDSSTTNSTSPVSVIGLGSGVSKIAAEADASTCAILSNDTIKCWGNNSSGQIGTNAGGGSTSPVTLDW